MDMVNAIARRVVPSGEDAQDLVQETYLAAYRAWTEHRRPRKVEPWLATICLNLARSRYRTRQRRPTEVPLVELTALAAETDGPEERAIAAMDRAALEQALMALPEEQRIAIVLVDLTDLSVKDAARIMGTPKGTILSRLHRGRRALALQLGSETLEKEAR
jgi:RNA polymerase sigma-70 factor (ECF subfamily)